MSSAQKISLFVLSKLEAEPIAKQIELYRALADLSSDSALASEMTKLANELEAIANNQMQLRFRAQARGNYSVTKSRNR